MVESTCTGKGYIWELELARMLCSTSTYAELGYTVTDNPVDIVVFRLFLIRFTCALSLGPSAFCIRVCYT